MLPRLFDAVEPEFLSSCASGSRVVRGRVRQRTRTCFWEAPLSLTSVYFFPDDLVGQRLGTAVRCEATPTHPEVCHVGHGGRGGGKARRSRRAERHALECRSRPPAVRAQCAGWRQRRVEARIAPRQRASASGSAGARGRAMTRSTSWASSQAPMSRCAWGAQSARARRSRSRTATSWASSRARRPKGRPCRPRHCRVEGAGAFARCGA